MPFTIKDVSNSLHAQRAKGTAEQYLKNLRPLLNHFLGANPDGTRDLYEALNQPDEIIMWILNRYKSPSTRRSHLGSYKFILERFGYSDEAIKKVQDVNREEAVKSRIDQDEKLRDPTNHEPKSKAVAIMASVEAQLTQAKKNMGAGYDRNRMLASYLHFILNYGAPRVAEIYDMKIYDGEADDMNYIDVENGIMMISNHKTRSSIGAREIKLNKDFIKLVKPGVGGYFIFNGDMSKNYSKASGAERMLAKATGFHNHEDLRKAKVSLLMNQSPAPIKKLKTLALIHGHDIPTMSKFYHKFTLEDPKPQPGDVDDKGAEEK